MPRDATRTSEKAVGSTRGRTRPPFVCRGATTVGEYARVRPPYGVVPARRRAKAHFKSNDAITATCISTTPGADAVASLLRRVQPRRRAFAPPGPPHVDVQAPPRHSRPHRSSRMARRRRSSCPIPLQRPWPCGRRPPWPSQMPRPWRRPGLPRRSGRHTGKPGRRGLPLPCERPTLLDHFLFFRGGGLYLFLADAGGLDLFPKACRRQLAPSRRTPPSAAGLPALTVQERITPVGALRRQHCRAPPRICASCLAAGPGRDWRRRRFAPGPNFTRLLSRAPVPPVSCRRHPARFSAWPSPR